MCPSVRSALLLSLVCACLTAALPRNEALAQGVNVPHRDFSSASARNLTFRPLQTNSTPDSTATAGATAVATNTPTPLPTQTSVPTTTPVPSAPAASTLLSAARAALKTANTSHFNLVEKVSLGGLVKGTVRERGDMSQRPAEVQAHVTGSLTALGKPQKIDERHVQIGKKAWVKSAKTHGVWKSEKATPANSAGSVQNPLDIVKGNGLKITDLKTVGAETFGSVAVWRIHGTVIAQVTQTTTTTGTVDYLIGKVGNLPYRIMENVNDPKDSLLLDLQATLGRFGEKVKVATPKIGSTLR